MLNDAEAAFRSACRTSARRRGVDNSTSLINEKEIVMAGINTGKVMAGGLLAGLVANAFDFVTNTYILARRLARHLRRRTTWTRRR